MSFLDIIERAKAYLERHHRMSLRALRREFDLDDEAVEELVEELVEVQQVAVLDGKTLAWVSLAGSPTPAVDPETPAAPTARRKEVAASPPAPDAERRQLTVMFCDLVGSTALSERLDPEELREVVHVYQETCADVIRRYEGHLAKYLGDGLLVHFGYPVAHEDDAERAVRAGLGIIDAMGELNTRLEGEHDVRLAVRVGIHTGLVVAGDMGTEDQPERLAIVGETPNVAARLQGIADPDTVVMSGTTLRLVAGMFVTQDLGTPALKGITEPLTVYRVLQPSGVRSRLDIAAGRLTRFVGRQVELATLAERWERAQDGEGQTVLVHGEAGVGKSRLVYELRERLAGVPHTWLECGATPYTEGTPFQPVIGLVAQGLRLAAEDTPAKKLAKVERGLGALTSTEAVTLLAEFLGLPPPTALSMSPDLQRRKTMDLLVEWNLALSAVQPLVVLVEDLHWSDASSLELLGRFVAQSPTERVLLLATARPEFTSPWPARENMTTLSLARLTKRQARDMVVKLGGTELPADTVDALVTRAGGVPLYVEELTKAMVEPGAARGAEVIPATLADSLMARLDRLSTAKEVAQRAAVLGREFSYPLFAAVAGLDEAALRHGLARLVEAEVVFAQGEPPEATYIFKHALVQEAAYESLLKRTRQKLHGRVVDVLETEFPERVAAEPEVVARHAEAAGRIDEAVTSYQRAGEQAQARSAHEETIHHLRQAIALLAKQPEAAERDACEVALQLALGGSLVVARGFSHPESEAAYDRARVLCDGLGDARRLGLALVGLAMVYTTRGEVEQGRAAADRVLTAAERSGDGELALHGHIQVAAPEYYQGRFASSLAHLEAARILYDAERHHAVVSVLAGDPGVAALNNEAWCLWQLGWPDRALARAREAVVLARHLADPFGLAFALFFETTVHYLRGDVTAQRRRAAETITLSEAQGFPLWLGLGKALLGATRAASEPNSVSEIMEGLAVAAETGNQAGAPGLFALLADSYLIAAQPAEARGAVETGLTLATETGQAFFDAELHRLQGEIVLATNGTSADAEVLFQRALDIARTQEAKSFELRAATSLARLWQQQGKKNNTRDLLTPIYAWFTEGFDTQDLRDAKALLEELG